jgi:ribulose-5-phosphate 4-epimerase/fuculose-1-phosphate aldolase
MLETCCDLMVEAYEKGLMTSRDGNVSLRYRGQDFFYLSPTDIRKQTLKPDQFKKLSTSLKEDRSPIALPYTNISLGLKPSGEFPLHYMLQRLLPKDWETRVVIHTHSTYTVAAMHAGLELHKLKDHFPEISRYTKVAKSTDDVPPISWDLAEACMENMKLNMATGETEFNIVGIKGHGVVSVDKTPWRAYEHIERLEHISKIILSSGKTI